MMKFSYVKIYLSKRSSSVLKTLSNTMQNSIINARCVGKVKPANKAYSNAHKTLPQAQSTLDVLGET